MAYMCNHGYGECFRCGECEEIITCPVCGEEPERYLYKQDGNIIGCDQCVEKETI